MLLLSASEVERLLDPQALLEALAEEFKALTSGDTAAPQRNQVAVDGAGVLMAMPAYCPGREITIKLVSVFHGNEARGLPGHHALICLFDAQTGVPVCMMDGTYITALRTAGSAALSTQLLARPDAQILTIIGAGMQGQAHLKMLPYARSFGEIRVASQRLASAERLAEGDDRARVYDSAEEATRGSDVVCLCTNAGEPVIHAEWLKPGAHVTSVGYRPPGGELDRAIAEQGRLFVETRLAFAEPPAGCGELVGLDPESGTELGELLLGQRPGRRSETEITVYKSMGHASEDMAAASLVYRRALETGVGSTVSL